MGINELLKKYSEIEDGVYMHLIQKFRTNRYSEEVVKSNPSGMTQAMINLLLLDEIKKLNENLSKDKVAEDKKSTTKSK